MGDECDQMQMPIRRAAPQIPNVGFYDGLGVDPHAFLIPPQSADQGIMPRVQLREFHVAQLCEELDISRATLYRYVGPDGALRSHALKALEA